METNIVDVQRKKYHTISARPIPALQTFWFLHEITLHEIQVSETAPMTQTMQKKTTYAQNCVSGNCVMWGLGVHSKFSVVK